VKRAVKPILGPNTLEASLAQTRKISKRRKSMERKHEKRVVNHCVRQSNSLTCKKGKGRVSQKKLGRSFRYEVNGRIKPTSWETSENISNKGTRRNRGHS